MIKKSFKFFIILLCLCFINATLVKAKSNTAEEQQEPLIEVKTDNEETESNKEEQNKKEIMVEESKTEETGEKTSVIYSTHVQSYGWQAAVKDGELSGTSGEAKRLEAIKINLSSGNGNIEYITYIQNYGWDSVWKKNGQISGTNGEAKRLEAIKIRLTGVISNEYDVYYRVHVQSYGWLNWAKNGETAGTVGLAKRLEAIEIKLIKKAENTDQINIDSQNSAFYQNDDYLNYSTHVQSYGWQKRVSSGKSGTEGKGKRIEAYSVSLEYGLYSGSLQYKSYIEGIGWESDWKKNGQISGTEGQSKRIEQIKMRLVGDIAEHYDIYYRVHVQGYGWLGWAKNEESAGTEDIGFRIECLEIKLVEKGTGEETGKSLERKDAYLSYSAHIRRIGDQEVVTEGSTSGTTGQGLRMEAIKINLDSELEGSILYKSYIDELGWEEDYKRNGEQSGTIGQSKGIQLLRIKLEGEVAEKYDVYYRIHTESFGWLDWAHNDEITGADCYDIQAVQIKLYLKIDGRKNSLNSSNIHVETGFYKENGYTYYKDKNGKLATDWIHIMDKKYFFNSLGVMIGKNVKKVMDVSAWQGDIDWDTVYRYGDIDGVILRIAAGCDYEDAKLARNIQALKRLNIPYGIYIYSYAETYNEGKTYADFTISIIKKYSMNPKIGIFFDLEANNITNYLTTQHYEELTRGYMDTMYQNGYGNITRIYTYKSLAEEKINTPYLYSHITWIAHYNHFNRYVNENVVGWQYTSQEYVPGVPTLADMSVWFTSF